MAFSKSRAKASLITRSGGISDCLFQRALVTFHSLCGKVFDKGVEAAASEFRGASLDFALEEVNILT